MAEVSAFERLCLKCRFCLPHPLYIKAWHVMEGPPINVIEEAVDGGPSCQAGLSATTRDGKDCPYFKESHQ